MVQMSLKFVIAICQPICSECTRIALKDVKIQNKISWLPDPLLVNFNLADSRVRSNHAPNRPPARTYVRARGPVRSNDMYGVRKHHIFNSIWTATIGKRLPCTKREIENEP